LPFRLFPALAGSLYIGSGQFNDLIGVELPK
jgi:hypothetical protein